MRIKVSKRQIQWPKEKERYRNRERESGMNLIFSALLYLSINKSHPRLDLGGFPINPIRDWI